MDLFLKCVWYLFIFRLSYFDYLCIRITHGFALKHKGQYPVNTTVFIFLVVIGGGGECIEESPAP